MVPALLLVATASQAALIGFGQDQGTEWSVSTINTSLGTSYSRSVTADDITFTIALASSANDIGYRQDRDNIGLLNDNTDYNGNADGVIGNGEGTLTMTIALSGTGVGDLTSLSLNDLWIRNWGNGEVATFGDGITTTDMVGDFTDHLDYTGLVGGGQNLGAPTALTALTKDNMGTWELSMVTGGSIALASAAFEYTVIPEPSSAALLGLGGLALSLRRRRA